MTHEDAGKYAAKHPPGTNPDPQIAAALGEHCKEGKLVCAVGEKIATELGVTIARVGATADLMELKIQRCQLGLFGWGPKPDHGKDLPDVGDVPAGMQQAIADASEGGQIACAALWAVAREFKAARKTVAAVCEKSGFKIRPCQLGAF